MTFFFFLKQLLSLLIMFIKQRHTSSFPLRYHAVCRSELKQKACWIFTNHLCARQASRGGIDSLILHKNTVSARVWFGDIKVIICKISVLVDLAPPVVTGGNSRCVLILQVPTRVSTTGGQQTRFCQKHNRRRTTWCVTNRSNCK